MVAWDDIVYVSLLVLTIISGRYVRQISSVGLKQALSTIFGLVIVYIVSGVHCLHPIIVTLVNSVIVSGFKRNCHIISFAFCFTYLAIFRLLHILEIITETHSHLNAIQMIHTLKMVGLAFEINDTYRKQKETIKSDGLQDNQTNINPSISDVFHYAFCHVGLLTGPYFKFRTYDDWLRKPYSSSIPVTKAVLERLKILPIIFILLFLGNHFFPLEYAKSEIYERSFSYRWWYMTPLFFNFRMRLYTAFVLSECCCMAAGLGLYPKSSKPKPGEGPTDFKELIKSESKDLSNYNEDDFCFDTIYNIDIWSAEFCPTVRGGLKSWNMTIQYWLAMFVHKRVKVFRVGLTMLTSAFWHGIYTGYYVGLLTVPFVLMAEDAMDRAVRRQLNAQFQKIYDFIWWIIKMQAFSYMGMGFFLVYSGETIRYWTSIYFLGHVMIVVFFLLGRFISSQIKSSSRVKGDKPQYEKKSS